MNSPRGQRFKGELQGLNQRKERTKRGWIIKNRKQNGGSKGAKVRGWKWRRMQDRYGSKENGRDQGSQKMEIDRGSKKKGIGMGSKEKRREKVKSQRVKGQEGVKGQRKK